MRASVLGREDELQVLSRFVDEIDHGLGVLVLTGDPGIGKTILWRFTVGRGNDEGCHVLTARPVEMEAQLAFSGLTDLLDSVPEHIFDSLPPPQRRALFTATWRDSADRGDSDPRAVTAATVGVLRALSSERRVLLAVDDVQWFDPASARVVAAVVRRLGDERVGVVVSERTGSGLGFTSELAEATAPEMFTRVEVDSLSEHPLVELVERRLGRQLPLSVHKRLQQLARGNPFFALELATALPQGATTGVSSFPLSPTLRSLVAARLAALPDRTREALLVAVASERPTVELVAVGLCSSPTMAQGALEPAAAAGLVELDLGSRRVMFAHPLYAAGVYDQATPEQRRHVHRRLAAAVDGLEARARHLALGQTETDAALADLLDRAANHARARGAPDGAAVLAVQAHRLTPADRTSDLARRALAVARFRFHAGELESARQMLVSLLESAEHSWVKAAALCLLAEIAYHQNGFGEAHTLFTRASLEVTDDHDVACRIEMHLAHGSVNTGQFDQARPHAQRAVAFGVQVGDDAVLSESLAVATIADYMSGLGLDEAKLTRSLALEDPFHQVGLALRPSLIAGLLMLYEGRLVEAVALLEGCRSAAVNRGEEMDLPLVTSNLIWAECWRGRLEDAARHGDQAIDTARRLLTPAVEGTAHAFMVSVEAHRGNFSAAHSHANRAFALAEVTGSDAISMWARGGLGLLGLAQGDPHAVHQQLEPLVLIVEERGLVEPVVATFLADEIEALVLLGDLDRAAGLADVLETSARRLDRRWALVQGLRSQALTAAARGELDDASRLAASARSWCDGLELEIEVARTFLVSGRIERRRRHRHESARYLTVALELFDGAGARTWSARTHDELERIGLKRRTSHLLTPTESRVANLSAAGLTNRAVANQLSISPKTVEANLSRVYRKLGIHSRAQLGARLVATDKFDS